MLCEVFRRKQNPQRANMPNNYDAAAWFYDALAGLIYGRAIKDSQIFLLQYLKPGMRILIVGGGTGWILEEIAKKIPASLNITYVEISGKMLFRSKRKDTGKNSIIFVHQPIEELVFTDEFDLIFTPFLFDNFSVQRIKAVFALLDKSLKINGIWLNNDFQIQTGKKSIWQKTLLQTMYLFFGWLCAVETRKLISMLPFFIEKGYRQTAEKTFYNGFILAQAFCKKG